MSEVTGKLALVELLEKKGAHFQYKKYGHTIRDQN